MTGEHTGTRLDGMPMGRVIHLPGRQPTLILDQARLRISWLISLSTLKAAPISCSWLYCWTRCTAGMKARVR